MSDHDMFDVYRSLVGMANMQVTDEGFVRMEVDKGEFIPVTAREGRMVVLPLTERLRDRRIKEYEVFHLLRESGAKDSDLLTRYRHWLINRTNIVLGGVGEMLLKIAASKDHLKSLSPEQMGFMELVEQADGDTVKTFSTLCDITMKPNQISKVFMSVYLRPAAVLDGKSYNRVAVVNFPFYDELLKVDTEAEAYKSAPKAKKGEKPENKVFGVDVRVMDRKPLLGLMRYLVPELDVDNKYDVGSSARISPGLDAMMRAFGRICGHLNAIMDQFRKVAPDLDRQIDEMYFNLDWQAAFDDLDALWPQIRAVPPQGTGVIEEPAPQPAYGYAAPAAPAYSQPAPYGAPAYQPPPQRRY